VQEHFLAPLFDVCDARPAQCDARRQCVLRQTDSFPSETYTPTDLRVEGILVAHDLGLLGIDEPFQGTGKSTQTRADVNEANSLLGKQSANPRREVVAILAFGPSNCDRHGHGFRSFSCPLRRRFTVDSARRRLRDETSNLQVTPLPLGPPPLPRRRR
jgi:hypothetical protein